MVKTLEAHGDYPQTVYRVFNDIEYAKDFINGTIRFNLLHNYRHIEDERRRDITEGEAHVVHNGLNHRSSFASNSFYILCCHKTLESAKESKFGKFIVEITNPQQLATEITKWLEKQSYKHYGGIEGVNVEYSHGEETDIKPTGIELARLTYAQKPNLFSDENEFRFVFIRESCKDDYVFIELNEAQQFCKII